MFRFDKGVVLNIKAKNKDIAKYFYDLFDRYVRGASSLHMIDHIKIDVFEVVTDHLSFNNFLRGISTFKGGERAYFAFKLRFDVDISKMSQAEKKEFVSDGVIAISMYYYNRGLTC